jgi:hypothetical protein
VATCFDLYRLACHSFLSSTARFRTTSYAVAHANFDVISPTAHASRSSSRFDSTDVERDSGFTGGAELASRLVVVALQQRVVGVLAGEAAQRDDQ